MRHLLILSVAASLLALGGCDDDPPPAAPPSPTATATASAAPEAKAPPAPPLAVYQGSAIARDHASRFVVVADEDHKTLRVAPLPLKKDGPIQSRELPGPPAQVLARPDEVLVTIRQPSLLLSFDAKDPNPATWTERWRVELPADAWGLALDPKQTTAFVSSAWAHQISAVNLSDHAVRWSADVAREPRGLLVVGDELYVNHLVGPEITRLAKLDGKAPDVERHLVPPAPLRTPVGITPGASLGYALAASPDGRRLFVPRHALGALGEWGWYGVATVDVWMVPHHKPVLVKARPRRSWHAREFPDPSFDNDEDKGRYYKHISFRTPETEVPGGPVFMHNIDARQPRHVLYRKRTDTLLVASEGQNNLVEMDALSPAPASAILREYKLGYEKKPVWEFPKTSGAPTGIALSEDEEVAYVYCRSTDDLVATTLHTQDFLPKKAPQKDEKWTYPAGAPTIDEPLVVRLVDELAQADPSDPKVELFQMGRATYYQADAERIGEGVACASCHPDGRDDGFVWRELHTTNDKEGEAPRLIAEPKLLGTVHEHTTAWSHKATLDEDDRGGARQTPMLAGRVAARGPYGWTAQSETLADRVAHGFVLHRTHLSAPHDWTSGERGYFAAAVAQFLREGLLAPARKKGPLTEQEKKGQELFMHAEVGCASCHDPKNHLSDGNVYPRIVQSRPGYRDERNVNFRTPSLAFVAGTPPYMHDGSRSTLEGVLKLNADRMGRTSQLSDEERAALVAYLRTL